MKRLVEQTFQLDSPEEWLADLVRATPPRKVAPFEAQRVLARVTGFSRRTGPLFARSLAIVLLLGAVAAAAAGRQMWHVRESPSLIEAQESPPPAQVVATAGPVASDGPPAKLPAHPSIERDRGAVSTYGDRSGAAKSFAAAEDPGLVLAAIRALRETGDPAQASVLLSRYLKLHPRGVLAEDAVALSIEAAADRHDERAIAHWGRIYLAQFPNGRFRAIALRATQQDAR